MIEFIIENEQDKADFTPELENVLQRAVMTVMETLDCADTDCEVSVLITDDEGIRAINLAQRGIDAPTDVLSFPIVEFDDDGVMIEDSGDYDGDLLLLGDIVISLERAKAQAEEYGHSLKREVGFLAAHSALHLMGFDHQGEEDTPVMRGLEKAVMEKMNLPRE